jgi:hypothetical protein
MRRVGGDVLTLGAVGVIAAAAWVGGRGSRGVDYRHKYTLEHPIFHAVDRLELYDDDGIFVSAFDAPETERWNTQGLAEAWLEAQRPRRNWWMRRIQKPGANTGGETLIFQYDGPEHAWSDRFLDPQWSYERTFTLVPTLTGPRLLIEEKKKSERRRRRLR